MSTPLIINDNTNGNPFANKTNPITLFLVAMAFLSAMILSGCGKTTPEQETTTGETGTPDATAPEGRLAQIKEKGTLTVAVPQDFAPFGSVGPDMSPQGYDIDMAQYLADQMGVELELVPVTSANRIPYLQTDKVDLVISSMGKNPEREAAIDFTYAYAPFYLGVFGQPDLAVTSAEDMADRTIGVTRGSVEDMELTKVMPKSTTIKRFEDNSGTLSSYLSGQLDLIATGNLVASEIAEKNPEKAPQVKFLLKNSPCYVGVKKGETALVEEVNQLIEKAKTDGVLEDLSQKWLHAPFPDNLDT